MKAIQDIWVLIPIVLSFLSTILCVVYGLMHWNEDVAEEEKEMTMEEQWELQEHQEVDRLLD